MLKWLWNLITGKHSPAPPTSYSRSRSTYYTRYYTRRRLSDNEDCDDPDDDNCADDRDDDGSGLTEEEKAGLVDWHIYGGGGWC